MTSKITFILLIFSFLITHAQTLKGKVLDATTKAPIESVSVYFDNTTIGTTTNDLGEFSITYNDAVQSTLVISFLGYNKVFITDYRQKENITIELNEAFTQLDEVVINTDDGMSRAVKLKWFRKEFLGKSSNGKSCKILNEEDIKLRSDKRKRTIVAWSNTQIIIKNKNLQYEISFDIIDFEIQLGNFNAASVMYSGTCFYKDLDKKQTKKITRIREKAYKGSVQHFIRALYNKDVEAQDYVFGKKGFVVKPYDFITISEADSEGLKSVKLLDKTLDIFYKDVKESVIETRVEKFYIDKYGNYFPIESVLFGGYLGRQRLGDVLPLDYGIVDN